VEEITVKDRRIIFILLCGSVAVGLILFSNYYEFEDKEFDDQIDGVFVSVGLSLLGLILFVFRRMGFFKEFTESLELLIFLAIPVIGLIPVLSEPKVNIILFAPIWFGIAIVWFLSVKYFFVKHIKKEKEKKYTDYNVKLIWGMLMVFGAMFVGIFIFFIVPFFVNPLPVE